MNAPVHTGIKLSPELQVLRDEIRTMDRYIRQGLLSQDEADARFGEWGITPVPGMWRFDRLALMGVWQDEYQDEFEKRAILKSWEAKEVKHLRAKAKAPPHWDRKYKTPQSTVDAYRFIKRSGDTARLEHWLKQHPRDASYLKGLSDDV